MKTELTRLKMKSVIARIYGNENEKEKLEFIQNVINYTKKKIKIDEEIKEDDYSKYRMGHIKCDCGREFSFRAYCDWNGNLKEEDVEKRHYEIFVWLIYTHARTQIRMNGCETHLKLFKRIFPKNMLINMLKRFALKNVLVAERLSKVIKELNT